MCRGYDFSNNSITVLILQQFKLQDNQQTTGLLFGTWSFAVPTVPITSSDANTRCVVGTSTSATMEPIISSMRPESTTNIKLQNTWRPLSSPHQISWLYPDLSRCLRHTGDSIQIGLHVVVSEQESMCEHIVHSKSSEIIVLDNTHLFVHRIHGNSPQAHIFPDFSRFSRLVAGLIISANKFWTNSSIWTRWTGRFKFWVIATGLLTWVRLVSRSARVQTRT